MKPALSDNVEPSEMFFQAGLAKLLDNKGWGRVLEPDFGITWLLNSKFSLLDIMAAHVCHIASLHK